MRWDELFADLEGQLAALAALDRDAEVAERTRAELSRVTFGDRLRGGLGRQVTCTLTGATPVEGRLERVAADFILVTEGRTEAVVPLTAIAGVDGLERAGPAGSRAADAAVAARLGMKAALRALARDRSVIRVDVLGGAQVVGTAAVVGADYVEVAVHGADEVPRPQLVKGSRLVPFASIQVIRRTVEQQW